MSHRRRHFVLIVEDDQWMRSVLKEVLAVEGFRVADAPNAHTALRILDAIQPSAIVLDLALPGVSGLELLWRTTKGRHCDIPVVVVSAYAELLPDEALANAACVLQKPIDLDDLIAVLGRLASSIDPWSISSPAGREGILRKQF
jgi:CheY-like chemotaxis protein